MKQDMKDAEFQNCHCQIFHSVITQILQPLKAAMTNPVVVQFPDHHFCQSALAHTSEIILNKLFFHVLYKYGVWSK